MRASFRDSLFHGYCLSTFPPWGRKEAGHSGKRSLALRPWTLCLSEWYWKMKTQSPDLQWLGCKSHHVMTLFKIWFDFSLPVGHLNTLTWLMRPASVWSLFTFSGTFLTPETCSSQSWNSWPRLLWLQAFLRCSSLYLNLKPALPVLLLHSLFSR